MFWWRKLSTHRLSIEVRLQCSVMSNGSGQRYPRASATVRMVLQLTVYILLLERPPMCVSTRCQYQTILQAQTIHRSNTILPIFISWLVTQTRPPQLLGVNFKATQRHAYLHNNTTRYNADRALDCESSLVLERLPSTQSDHLLKPAIWSVRLKVDLP